MMIPIDNLCVICKKRPKQNRRRLCNICVNKSKRERYHSDTEYREKETKRARAYSNKKYHTDENYKQKNIESSKHYIKNNPEQYLITQIRFFMKRLSMGSIDKTLGLLDKHRKQIV